MFTKLSGLKRKEISVIIGVVVCLLLCFACSIAFYRYDKWIAKLVHNFTSIMLPYLSSALRALPPVLCAITLMNLEQLKKNPVRLLLSFVITITVAFGLLYLWYEPLYPIWSLLPHGGSQIFPYFVNVPNWLIIFFSTGLFIWLNKLNKPAIENNTI